MSSRPVWFDILRRGGDMLRDLSPVFAGFGLELEILEIIEFVSLGAARLFDLTISAFSAGRCLSSATIDAPAIGIAAAMASGTRLSCGVDVGSATTCSSVRNV